MTAAKNTNPGGMPGTLMQAHRELVCIRPDRDASLPTWLAYYERSASVYEHIAEVDPGHEGEAQYWAQRERVRARKIKAQINGETPGE
ncbi:MAG TPA: AMED_5909 family protein [Pseudonocardiaceae bacterium]|nr:AMED_5909 family protein [Pseudonocardiaceae bacterium]